MHYGSGRQQAVNHGNRTNGRYLPPSVRLLSPNPPNEGMWEAF